MTSGPTPGGTPGQTPGGPPPPLTKEQQREARRRVDRVYGVALLLVGMFATILSMTGFTENALAQQFAAVSEQYGVDSYTRPAGLAALSLAGIIGQPVIYAIALYLTLIVWRRGGYAAWIPLLGAVLALIYSGMLLAVGAVMHPELIEAMMASAGGVSPTPTP